MNFDFGAVTDYFVDRMKEPSTYKGIALVLVGLGLTVDAELAAAWGSLLLLLLGAWEAGRVEPSKP